MKPIIEIKNIGKKYNINHHKGGYVALRDVFANIAKSPFKFLGQKTKKIFGTDTKEEFWALRNVNLEIEKGEVVGIIGHNGAGKSTLLKILTGITPPTEGEITMRGSVASLLEVGTGFHPELTGRENIFLNGAILGMTKKEITEKFDDIVAFSGVEKFLDTPVKYYSSGMYVRLAFSVAAHMEPDILLVDEVLAVGDAEFQKKCLGKMEEVTKTEGRTIIFVSHNITAIQQICKKTILIEKGEIKMFDDTEKVINHYLNDKNIAAITTYNSQPDKEAQVTKVSILGKSGAPQAKIPISENFFIEVEYSISRFSRSSLLSLLFYSNGELLLLSSESDKEALLFDYSAGKYKTRISIPGFLFNVGMYAFDIRLHRPGIEIIDEKQKINFEIIDEETNSRSIIFQGQHLGRIASILDYTTIEAN